MHLASERNRAQLEAASATQVAEFLASVFRGSNSRVANGSTTAQEHELIRIDDALDELALKDPALAELVQLKYFCGLTLTQIGVLRGVTKRTVQRPWEKARLLLFDMLKQPRVAGSIDP